MRLSAAARYFDKTLCQDTFSPGTTFLGQLDLFDDSKRDGVTVGRRVLSVDPSVAVPARRVITVHGDQWIVGTYQTDSFRGDAIRTKYILQRANGAATIKSAAQILGTAGSVSTYAAKLWVKDVKEVDTSSKLEGYFNVYLPTPDAIVAGNIVSLGGRLYLVRNLYLSAAGFNVAEVDELALDAVGVGTYSAMTFTPASDGRAVSGTTALNVLKTRWQDLYAYANEAEPKYVEGDLRVLIRKVDVANAKVNDQFTVGGETYEILSAVTEDAGACWGLHLRHAGN